MDFIYKFKPLNWRALKPAPFWFFIVSILLVYKSLLVLLGVYAQMASYSNEAIELIVQDNTLAVQVLGVLGGIYLFKTFCKDSAKRSNSLLPPMRPLEFCPEGAFWGFFWASVPVILSVLLGFLQIELASFRWSFLWSLAPYFIVQLLTCLTWCWALESFLSWAQTLVRSPAQTVILLSILTGAFVEDFHHSPFLLDQIMGWGLCISLSLTFWLWTVSEKASWSLIYWRRSWTFAFLGALYFVYGQWRAGLKSVSALSLIEGTQFPYPTSLLEQGILGQPVFVLCLLFLINATLYRLLTRSPVSSFLGAKKVAHRKENQLSSLLRV